MSMSTHVIGFKPPNAKWKAMKAVWDACEAAELPVPDEVLNFFGHVAPDDAGVQMERDQLPITDWSREGGGAVGYELDVSKLDPDIKIIRFYNSW